MFIIETGQSSPRFYGWIPLNLKAPSALQTRVAGRADSHMSLKIEPLNITGGTLPGGREGGPYLLFIQVVFEHFPKALVECDVIYQHNSVQVRCTYPVLTVIEEFFGKATYKNRGYARPVKLQFQSVILCVFDDLR